MLRFEALSDGKVNSHEDETTKSEVCVQTLDLYAQIHCPLSVIV